MELRLRFGLEEEWGCGDAKTFSFYLSRNPFPRFIASFFSFCMHAPLTTYGRTIFKDKLRLYKLTSYSGSTD